MSVIFLGLAGYLGSSLYERAFSNESSVGPVSAEGAESDYTYPASIEIKSADGRMMMVTLLGRSTTHIEFTRADGQEFAYPIKSLDADSQALVRRHTNFGIKNTALYMAQGSMEIGDLYVQELEKRVREIEEKMRALSQEYGGSSSKVERRTIRRSVEALQSEKAELQSKISVRQ